MASPFDSGAVLLCVEDFSVSSLPGLRAISLMYLTISQPLPVIFMDIPYHIII